MTSTAPDTPPVGSTGTVGAADPPQGIAVRAHRWLIARWPATWRRRIAVGLALVAAVIAIWITSARVLRLVFDDLDLLAYAGLFITCWIGAGGLLVPIPGVRWLGFLMIVQQGAALDPIAAAGIGAVAMALGQTSWFLAARAAASRRQAGGIAADPDGTPEVPTPAAAEPRDGAAADGRRARWAARTERARQATIVRLRRHDITTIFLASLVPSPLTTVTSSSAGAIGVPYPRFLVAALAGFGLLSAILALFGQSLVAIAQRLLP